MKKYLIKTSSPEYAKFVLVSDWSSFFSKLDPDEDFDLDNAEDIVDQINLRDAVNETISTLEKLAGGSNASQKT